MGKESYTNLYISIPKEDDMFIDALRLKKIKEEKKDFRKTDICRHLVSLGIEVEKESYIKIDSGVDDVIKKLQVLVIENKDSEFRINKTKTQVVNMLIEKGLQNLKND